MIYSLVPQCDGGVNGIPDVLGLLCGTILALESKKKALLLKQASRFSFPSLSRIKPKADPSVQTIAAQQLVQRVLKDRAADFIVSVDPNITTSENDAFIARSKDGKVEIVGTTGVAVAMGLYYYLVNYCNCQITWGGQQLNIPSPLPTLPAEGLNITANDKFRFYQNVCTVSYSFAWYDFEDWEKQIDWMALHSINMPLAYTGQEAIFQRVYMKMGFTMDDLQHHFGGPAFLAWSRMGNMHGWGGPIPQSWIDEQLILQHKILDRVRSLGMIPVLPGFAGHVPDSITLLYPDANVSRLGDWAGFDTPYCCNYLLDFDDPLFNKVGSNFINEMTDEFGTDHVYLVDTFNEMRPQSNSSAYLAKASLAVYESLKLADPQALWMMQGWLFQDTGFWKEEQIKAYLTAIPQGEMLILDLYSEVAPIFTHTESYYGQPFIWCMLHDFGGTMELYGALVNINNGPTDGRRFPDSTMVGIGITPEGIYQNEVIYEFFLENWWRSEPRDITKWISDYVLKRYGMTNQYMELAWQYLKMSVYYNDGSYQDFSTDDIITRRPQMSPKRSPFAGVYNNKDDLRDHSAQAIPTSRPKMSHALRPDLSVYNDTGYHHDNNIDIIPTTLPRITPLIQQDVWYNAEDLFVAWDIFTLSARDFANSSLFRYDLVDIARNSLQILSIKMYTDLVLAFGQGNAANVKQHGTDLIALLTDMETLLASDSHFLLGRWIAAARKKANVIDDIVLYEFNARNQVTLWGPRGEIRDYACKQWSGLLKDYYIPRWMIFVDHAVDVLANNKTYNTTALNDMIYEKVELPFSSNLQVTYPTEPTGDSVKINQQIHQKYRSLSQDVFFQTLQSETRKRHENDKRDQISKKYGIGRQQSGHTL
ncbi:hypothetical protein FSP39_016333 [Pinctada imbricata]|uniref:Alpha-N-acetylglucosaminidase n=1 Tax=Pinctada imbricata TaxID=66713 RepID=A0AA88XJ52_PINIB|nr:hypothetical protein FSP39_016333 [Pinctada imbricata]